MVRDQSLTMEKSWVMMTMTQNMNAKNTQTQSHNTVKFSWTNKTPTIYYSLIAIVDIATKFFRVCYQRQSFWRFGRHYYTVMWQELKSLSSAL